MPEFDSTLEYRDVAGFPGYKVGNDGSVWSCLKRVSLGIGVGSRMKIGDQWTQRKPCSTPTGYLFVALGRHKQRYIHRLVLVAFVGPCPAGTESCHNDGDPSNNHFSNLRWDTPKSNKRDKQKHGTQTRGESHPQAKLSEKAVVAIRSEFAEGLRIRDIAKRHGATLTNAIAIVSRKTWKHI